MSRPRSKHKRKQMERAQRAKVKQASARHYVLRGEIKNNQCLLDLTVSHPSGQGTTKAVQAIIDTGATNSTIHPDIAKELKLPVVRMARVLGVHGENQAKVVIMQIGVKDGNKKAYRPIEAFVPDAQTPTMLFGMDAMMGGVLTVDTNAQRWEWRLTKVNRN